MEKNTSRPWVTFWSSNKNGLVTFQDHSRKLNVVRQVKHGIEEMMKGGKKKDKKKRKKDKGTVAVDLEMSCEIEERNDQQNKLKKARNSNKEKTCKESLPEAEGTKDKGKKKCRKDKDARSLDVETVENETKKKKESFSCNKF